jgi:hypothetical protein
MTAVYEASSIRRRATKAEMEERAEFLIDYASEHGPVTVRGLYYQAEVHGIPGITKDDRDYDKVQRQVLVLRRAGRLAYQDISDATRGMRKPTTHTGVKAALEETARFYRKSLWEDAKDYVEIWCEKDALAGVIFPITSLYDVPLMITRGFSSETFCFEAIAARSGDTRPFHVKYLCDFDRAGRDAARSLEEKLCRFADEEGIEIIFETLAVTEGKSRNGTYQHANPSGHRWPIRNGHTTSPASLMRSHPMTCAPSLRWRSTSISLSAS